jgi:phage terminase large subunit-like protein
VLGDESAGVPIVAGPFVRLACERHLRDRTTAAGPGGHPGGWWFDHGAADFVIQFFETVLRLPDMKDEDGEHLPFLLESSQDFIIGSIFGWKGRDGYRRFREGYIEIGKGNGKTPLFAGIGLYGITEDEEQAAEIYSAASTKEQSKIMFRDAERMVDCSPELRTRLRRTVNNIADPETDSFFRPFSRDEGTRSGPRPHMGLIDELHEQPAGGEITLKMKAGAKRRKQPFFGEITNSGFDRTSICWQHHEHSRLVLEQQLTDDRWFAYVCALDKGDDPLTDPSCWIKTNPLMGISVTREYLERQVQNATNIPAETNTVLRLNFCVWTAQNVRLIPTDQWAACSEFIPDSELVGRPCYGGIDLGQTDDLSAWLRIWDLEDGRIAVRARFWIPEKSKEKYPNRPYEQWERAGILEVTQGNITDYDVIQDVVAEDCEIWGVREVAYDKRFAQQMALHLQGEGVTMVDTPQGFQLTEPIKKLLELVSAALLAHGANAILAWMAGNVEGKHGRDKQIRIDKEASGDKIDGISALVMAISRWIVEAPDDNQSSHYDQRGVLVI